MSTLDLKELQAPLKEKERIRNDIYDKVLTRCHSRIKMVARQPNTFCYFLIPEFVLGVPVYNFQECKQYIIKSLTENGLAVSYIEPNLLFISWDVEHMNSKQINTSVNQEPLPMSVSSNLNYLAPQQVTQVQEQVQQQQQQQQQQQPVQIGMQNQQYRNIGEYKPIGMFGSPQDKMM